METLIIQNFGPIKYAEIEVKHLNVYIGSTATGKSTTAKMVAIFSSLAFYRRPDRSNFEKQLAYYNIGFPLTNNTFISYKKEHIFWKWQNSEVSTNLYQFRNTIELLTSVYDAYRSVNLPSNLNPNPEVNTFIARSLFSIYLVDKIDSDTIISELNAIADRETQSKFAASLDKLKKARNEIAHSPGGFFDLPGIDNTLQEFVNILTSIFEVSNIIYVPAERVALSMLSESSWGILNKDLSLPFCFSEFGSKFEAARNAQRSVNISILDATYEFNDGQNRIIRRDGSSVKLERASSGFQSLVPMYAVVDYYSRKQDLLPNLFIFEEPELNLYPTVQKDLVEFIIRSCQGVKSKLIITTHSPYILTSLDNLVQANNVFEQKEVLREQIAALVPNDIWLRYDDATCYYFSAGMARSTLDAEDKTLGTSNIDDVSAQLGETFEKLLDLKYS